MKYGIRDGMLGEPLETMFTVAREIGFHGIEFCINGDYQANLLWQADGPEKLKKLADADSMEISSLSPGFFASMHPALPDAEKRTEGRRTLTRVIEFCPLLAIRDILVPMFPRDFADWPEMTWKMLIDGFKPLAEVAEKHQVTLDLETTFSADQLMMIIDGIGSNCVKIYYDTGNQTNRGYDVAAELRQLGDAVGMIHAKDTDQQMLGEGRVDFASVDAAIRAIGYDGYIVLETPTGDDPPTANARNLAFIERLGV